jgi:DNA primase
MAGLIPQSFIDELIARADIVEIIGSRVQLKKAGREYKACCPFHGEKTPSFTVSPDKQFYHCFGCGAHGTALGFLMQHDRLSFPEAIEDLAARIGLEVPREVAQGQSTGARRADDSAYQMMARVARFYSESLADDPRARSYLETRGITAEAVERFGIGYAPNSWNELLKRFGGTEDARRRLSELGLIVERERAQAREGEKHYDRFRDRIMFPIRDARGRTIAFGGRIIDAGEPKYLNSPETALFHKGRELYGLYEVRQSRAPLKRLMIVEGYMDTVRLHQAGIVYAVATLGTATTPEHFKRVFRLVSEVTFAFDGDRAGRAAAWRALQHALAEVREGREIRFLFLPEGHDPDSLVGAEGRDAFEKRLSQALPLSEYLVRELTAQGDLTHADGRASFAAAARPLIARIPAGVYHELLLNRVAEAIGLSVERLESLWSEGPAPAPASSAAANPRSNRTRRSAGRGSLVQQAVEVLLNAPELASQVNERQLQELTALGQSSTDFLCEMLASLRAHPAQSAAQVIERYRDHAYAKHLQRLAARELLISDRGILANQLQGTVDRLITEELHRQRFEPLIGADASAAQLKP